MDDLISRQAAIDAIGEKSDEIFKTKQKGATYPHDDFFQGMAYAENVVKQLPPAQPKRGRWIYKNDLMTVPTGYWECSECKEGRLLYEENFCPHCGADMREVTT